MFFFVCVCICLRPLNIIVVFDVCDGKHMLCSCVLPDTYIHQPGMKMIGHMFKDPQA